MEHNIDFEKYHKILDNFNPLVKIGKVTKVVGLTIEGKSPIASIGEVYDIHLRGKSSSVTTEIVGFKGENVILMPMERLQGISAGCQIISEKKAPAVRVGEGLLGRVIDGMGHPIDSMGKIGWDTEYPLYNKPVNPLTRSYITEPLDLGIRAVNGLLTCGKGQRIGIFSATGLGKSILLGMIARHTVADVIVIALIGERGREVREFIDKKLGQEGLKKSVVVVVTSDQSPLLRMRGAFTATAVAEYFRDRGKNVLLLMDSVTRFAMAQREIGLSSGEPPATKGYTPSVFAILPQLLERAGTTEHSGSITGIYTVLVEGDDINEPVSDAVRSIIDGHIVLSKNLASRGHYPAIDVLNSISRVMIDILSSEHAGLIRRCIDVLATYRETEDLINIGAYVKGSNPKIDFALSKIDAVNSYLRQDINEKVSFSHSYDALRELFG